MAKDDGDLLKQAREAFARCEDAENENRENGLADLRFARLGEQWPEEIRKQRERERRPCLTINKLPTFIRQVVNDSRQNKPAIHVHPVDDTGDPETAEIISGLVRNIESVSNADIAYDTAIESAVSNGFGYIRVNMDYARSDAFDMDLLIERVANPFSVYGDPNSTSADGSDWNVAFIVEPVSKDEFEARFGDKAKVDFDDTSWADVGAPWHEEDRVLIAEWWTREEVEVDIVRTADGKIFDAEQLTEDEDLAAGLMAGLIQIEETRKAKRYKVTQRIMTGAEILETNEWPGQYIPIAPVYGEEFVVDGRRYTRSLIHNAVDAQRMFNFWRTAATELVALAPKSPFIGRKGTFNSDPNWQTANTVSHPYLEYDTEPPQRQPLDSGPAAGALQEAMNANDDMKSVMGLYDASLGARSNETSGRAIMARQREGDISTFHFIDNLSRAIRHVGRILIDLIPKVYTKPRIVRILNEDGSVQPQPVNQQAPKIDPKTGQPMRDPMGNVIMAMHDLTVGKYDLIVKAGPSFTSRREEAAMAMNEFVRAFPPAAPVLGDLMAKNFDWPGADEIAKRLESLVPPQAKGGPPPEVMAMQQQMQQMQQVIQQLQQENQSLKQKTNVEMQKVAIDGYEAQTDRMKAVADIEQFNVQALQNWQQTYPDGTPLPVRSPLNNPRP